MDDIEKAAWDNLINRDKRAAYTVDVLQELLGEDDFRELYIKQHQNYIIEAHLVESPDRYYAVIDTIHSI